MEIEIEDRDGVTVATLTGEINTRTYPQAQERLGALVQPAGRLLLEMSGVTYMSSAGLRLLLSLHRRVTREEGRVILAGLDVSLRDTMEITGFLTFFETAATLDEGLDALRA